MLDLEKIANNLYTLRKQRNITQTELAEALNVTHQAVSKWESAKSLPDLEVLASLAEYYGVTMDSIVNGEEVVASKPKSKDTEMFEYIIGQIRLYLMYISGGVVFGMVLVVILKHNTFLPHIILCVTIFGIGFSSIILTKLNFNKNRKSAIKFIIESIYFLICAVILFITALLYAP